MTGFDSIRVPAECTKFRLTITQNPGAQEYEKMGMDVRPEIIAFTKGNLTELTSATLELLRREGSTHDLVVNLLAADLWGVQFVDGAGKIVGHPRRECARKQGQGPA